MEPKQSSTDWVSGGVGRHDGRNFLGIFTKHSYASLSGILLLCLTGFFLLFSVRYVFVVCGRGRGRMRMRVKSNKQRVGGGRGRQSARPLQQSTCVQDYWQLVRQLDGCAARMAANLYLAKKKFDDFCDISACWRLLKQNLKFEIWNF